MIDYKLLISNAAKIKEKSYSPYSNFKVGACVLTEDGECFSATNVENASYGGAICAERNALNYAIAHCKTKIIAIAVITQNEDFAYPCGLCRQSLVEINPDMEVIVAKNLDEYRVHKAKDLLPHFFSRGDIKWEQL